MPSSKCFLLTCTRSLKFFVEICTKCIILLFFQINCRVLVLYAIKTIITCLWQVAATTVVPSRHVKPDNVPKVLCQDQYHTYE